MTETKVDVTKDLDNVSEAETIKDAYDSKESVHFNDDTEVEDVNVKATVSIEEKLEESEV